MTRLDWIPALIGLGAGIALAVSQSANPATPFDRAPDEPPKKQLTADYGQGTETASPLDTVRSEESRKQSLYELRLTKYRLIASHYPDSGIHPWIGTIIREHTRRDMGHAIWYSFVYGAANFSLRCNVTAPGRCYGPFDVKAPVPKYRRQACAELHDGPWQTSLLRNPQINARCHVLEMQQAYRRGYRGLGMCKYVYLPAAPTDWGGGRLAQVERRHKQIIQEAYERGELP